MKPSTVTRKDSKPGGSILLPSGTAVYDPRHPQRHVYLVERGAVQLSDGSDVILDHLGAGGIFGEKLFAPRPRSLQSATTVSPVRLRPFEKRELVDRMQKDRRFASRVLRGLADRIDRHEQSIREFATERAARRLALVLFRLVPRRPASGWVRLPWNPSNPELARRIGTTRWRVSRLVNQFRRLGWLRREQGLWVRRDGIEAFLQSTQHTP